jgi:hypothetical protein
MFSEQTEVLVWPCKLKAVRAGMQWAVCCAQPVEEMQRRWVPSGVMLCARLQCCCH